jgi:hypothetical protein
MSGRPCLLCFCVSLAIVIFTISVAAQDTPVDSAAKAPASATPAASDTTALAKATQNPVASLISVWSGTSLYFAHSNQHTDGSG